jgi:hypothetical protein
MLCEAATEDTLPPIWRILANVKKKEAVVAVSQLLESRAREADSFFVAPVVTPELLERIFSFKAGAQDVDDITAGFSLFLLITGSPEATTQARDRAVVYGLLQGAGARRSVPQSAPQHCIQGTADGTHAHCLGTFLSGLQHPP